MPKTSDFNNSFIVLTVAAGFIFVSVGLAAASPQSRQLILLGHADMEAGKYEDSLQKFHDASKADPKDSEAFYFGGAALNRLGRFDEALRLLEGAAAMGYRGMGLSFDTGWALLRLGRWADAVKQLEHFERLVPGRAKTSEFLGQAYLGLAQYDRAEFKLKEAIQRDPNLKSTALLHLAMLERSRNNRQAAENYVQTLMRELPDSPMTQTLKKYRESLVDSKKKNVKATY